MNLPLTFGKIVVIDVECTCWRGAPPPDQTYEIIEVGVCLLSVDSLKISRPRRIFIRPRMSEISEFCTELTGITEELIQQKGMTQKNALNILINEYKMDKRAWAGWGSDDFEMNQQFGNVFSKAYVNVASLFTAIKASPRSIGLKDAVAMIGAEFKGSHHNGGDDAYNAAVVLKKIIEKVRDED